MGSLNDFDCHAPPRNTQGLETPWHAKEPVCTSGSIVLKKKCQRIQAAGHSGGGGSVARSVYGSEWFILTPFPDLKEWGCFGQNSPGVRLRVQQAVAKAFMGCVGA